MPLELDTRAIEWIGEQYRMYYRNLQGTPIKPTDLGPLEIQHRAAKATLSDLRKQLLERESNGCSPTS